MGKVVFSGYDCLPLFNEKVVVESTDANCSAFATWERLVMQGTFPLKVATSKELRKTVREMSALRTPFDEQLPQSNGVAEVRLERVGTVSAA